MAETNADVEESSNSSEVELSVNKLALRSPAKLSSPSKAPSSPNKRRRKIESSSSSSSEEAINSSKKKGKQKMVIISESEDAFDSDDLPPPLSSPVTPMRMKRASTTRSHTRITRSQHSAFSSESEPDFEIEIIQTPRRSSPSKPPQSSPKRSFQKSSPFKKLRPLSPSASDSDSEDILAVIEWPDHSGVEISEEDTRRKVKRIPSSEDEE